MQNKLFKLGFKFPILLKEELGIFNSPLQNFFEFMSIKTKNKTKPYDYMLNFIQSPLPEHLFSKIFYFSKITNNEMQYLINFYYFSDKKLVRDNENFFEEKIKIPKNEFRKISPTKINLFNWTNIGLQLINSGNGYFFGQILEYLINKFKKSFLEKKKIGDLGKITYFESFSENLKLSDKIQKLVKEYKNKFMNIRSDKNYGFSEKTRILGNCKINNSTYRDHVLENAFEINPLESLMFSAMTGNFNADVDPGILRHAIEYIQTLLSIE